jgi:HlyD family secretion protein
LEFSKQITEKTSMNINPVKYVIITVIGVLLLSACGAVGGPSSNATPTTIPPVEAESGIITEGRLEPIRHVELALNASGLVSEVLVKEGEQVTAGQVIAHVESTEAKTLEAALADASAGLTAAYQGVRDAQYDLDNFDVPSDFQDMTPSQAVQATLDKLNVARDNFEPYKYLSERQFEQTKAERQAQREGKKDKDSQEGKDRTYRDMAKLLKKRLDDAWADYRKAIQWMELESALTSAKARLGQAQHDYESLQDPSLTENTAGARAALANAEVRAPFAGVITNLDLKVGEFASAGIPVITIADTSKWVVKTTDLTEIDVVNVKDGEAVEIALDAMPDVTLKGNVFSIAQNYAENQGDIVYEVTVLLTDQNPGMRWGMTAEVTFEK